MTEQRALLRSRTAVHTLLLMSDGLWDLSHDGRQDGRHADFGAWCSAHPGQRAELWLGSACLSDLVCDPAAPLQGGARRADWARRVLQHYHGDAALSWPLLPWRHLSALGASALHGVALPMLHEQAQAQGVTLLAVRPLWPVLLDRLLALRPELRRAGTAQAWIVEAGADQALLACVVLSHGQVRAVERRRLPTPWPAAVEARVDEDAGLRGVPLSALLLGPAPAEPLALDVALSVAPPYRGLLARRTGRGPDFLHPLARPTPRAWVCMGTALLVLALAAWDASQAWRQRAQTLALALPAATRPAATRAAPRPIDTALQQRLSHPWRDVFLASEAPDSVGLSWLTLEHRVGGELRLQGLAVDAEPVQRAAAVLRARPAWRQVLVSRLETQPNGQSFEIVARLAGAAR